VNVSIASAAEAELAEAADFYLREAGATVSRVFLAEFERAVALIADQPAIGAPWRASIRRLPLRRFPYSVLYEVRGAEIRLIAVAHQRRKPGFWRGRT
jgi:plasmid stabilization system protein ParE